MSKDLLYDLLYNPLVEAISLLIIATLFLLYAFLSSTLLPEQRAMKIILSVVGYSLAIFFFYKYFKTK